MHRIRRSVIGLVTALLVIGGADAGLVAAEGSAAAEVAPLPFDHILPHAELTDLLQGWVEARPNLIELTDLGLTPGGREMWFITLTNRATGPSIEKPALLVDGNEHATEWTGGVAALHLVWTLLKDYGADDRVTRLLDTRTVYVLPRMSPDGVDATLEQHRFIRSVDRPYPKPEPAPGLHPRDIDGDGRAVFMRFPDPNGPWVQHPDDPRLLVARRPDEYGGEYWRVVREGEILGWDGATITEAPPLEGMNFGVNFPGDRGQTPRGRDAGPYPVSEPEVAAYVAAAEARPNIVAYFSCHSFGGLILIPPVNVRDRVPHSDALVYEHFSQTAAELTGYQAITYLDLRTFDREHHVPSTFGWMYERRGVLSYLTEFWNPLDAAGISLEGTTVSAWLWGFHPIEDEIELLRWNDEELDGRGFVQWHAFDHPQLGPVEIGGWDKIHYWYNAPFDRLEAEVAPHTEWLIYHGLALPRLEIRSFAAEAVSADLWRVRLVVENSGWLPTYGTEKADHMRAVDEVFAELEVPAGTRLVNSEEIIGLGQLEGRSNERSTATWWGYTPGTPDRAVADWLVMAPEGTSVSVTAHHDRAGTARAEVVLK